MVPDIDSLFSEVAGYSPILRMAKADIDVLGVTRVLQMDLKVLQEPGYILVQVVGQCYDRTALQKCSRQVGAGTGDCKHLRRAWPIGDGPSLVGCRPISFLLWIAPSRSEAARPLCQTVLVRHGHLRSGKLG